MHHVWIDNIFSLSSKVPTVRLAHEMWPKQAIHTHRKALSSVIFTQNSLQTSLLKVNIMKHEVRLSDVTVPMTTNIVELSICHVAYGTWCIFVSLLLFTNKV